MIVMMADPRWKHPFTSIISGPTGSGKSYFVTKFIKHLPELIDKPIKEVIWCYSEWQELYASIQNPIVKFHQGLPQLNDFKPPYPARLLIIDDLMREADDGVVDLYTKGSHHRNMDIMLLSQNIFHQGKGRRDISLNSHYIVCFKSPRDRSQIKHLARQVYPDKPLFVQEAFEDATSIPHGYLLFDFKQSTPDYLRFRTSIFPDDKYCTVYIPKGTIKSQNAVTVASLAHHV